MSDKSLSPFQRRLMAKLSDASTVKWSREDVREVQRAFVEALREEVEERFAMYEPHGRNTAIPLRIAGLGSFKMRTRPQRVFDSFRCAQHQSVFGDDGARSTITKPPARRLVFTAKWEEIK